MDKLNTIVEKTLQIAEKGMQEKGFSNPKVVIFYRDLNNDLETYMVDLAPKKYFDGREEIMKQVGTTFKTMAAKKQAIRNIEVAVAYGEAQITIDKQPKKSVVMASAQDSQGNTVTRFKEVRHYLMPDHPEKTFFELQDLEIQGLNYKQPSLVQLFNSFTK